MSEVKVQDTAQELTAKGLNTSGTDNRETELLREVMQKKERLNSAIERSDTLQSKYDELQKQITDKEESRKIKQMEEKGEYDKIIADMSSKLETSEKKSKAWDEYQSNRRETLLAVLPEDERTIYGKLPLTELEFHVSKVNTKPSPASVDNSTPTSTGGYASFEEWATLDPKGYKKANDPQTSGKIKIGYGD
jgi:seryl-tRNA synthetase